VRRERGSIVQAVRNMLPPRRPYAWWLVTTLRNVTLRVTRRQDCCGHPGEPGC